MLVPTRLSFFLKFLFFLFSPFVKLIFPLFSCSSFFRYFLFFLLFFLFSLVFQYLFSMWKVLTFQNDFFCIWPNLVLAKRSKTARPNFDWRNLVTPPVDGLEPTPQLLSWRLRPWKFHVLKEKEHRRHAPQIDLRVRPQFVRRCAAVFVSVEQEELDFQKLNFRNFLDLSVLHAKRSSVRSTVRCCARFCGTARAEEFSRRPPAQEYVDIVLVVAVVAHPWMHEYEFPGHPGVQR